MWRPALQQHHRSRGELRYADPVRDYQSALASAKKTLGKEGALPKPRVDPMKVLDELDKTITGFNKLREEMEKTAVNVDGTVAKLKAAAKQYGDIIDGDDFGLDAKGQKTKR